MKTTDGVFELFVNGYETYYPILFLKLDSSDKQFKKDVRKAINETIPVLSKDHYIAGYDLIEGVREILVKEGYVVLKPSSQINLDGECLYNSDDTRPSIITIKNWKAILKHNMDIDHSEFGEK